MAVEEEILIEIKIDRDQAQKGLKQSTAAISKLTDETKKLQTEQKKLDKNTKEGTERFNRNARVVAANKQQLSELRKEQKLNIQTLQQEDNSLNALRTSLIKLKRDRDNVNQSTEEGKQQFLDLTDQIKNTTDAVKEQEQAGGDFRRSVGNYGEALDQAKDSLGAMVPGLGAVGQGIGGITKAGLRFIATPIGLIIAAIAIALKAVSNALSRTTKGVGLMDKATAAFQGVLLVFEKTLTLIGSALISAFEDPKQAVIDLWEVIKENLINRVEGLLDFWVGVGEFFGNVITGEFDKLEESLGKIGTALIQTQTGLDKAQQQSLLNFFSDVVDEVNEATEALNKLTNAQRELRTFQRDAELRIANLEREIELTNILADDATKGFKEREEAARKASDLIIQKSKEELAIARRGVDIANLQLSLIRQRGDTAGEELESALDAQAEANKSRIEAETNLTLSIRQNELIRSQLVQDRLEKDLDILIDGFDNQKTINEQLIADEELTFEKRSEILDRTKALSDISFNSQAETLQQFTDQAIDFNDLLATSDAEQLNQKIRLLELSEIVEGRLLEVIRERRIVTQDLNVAEKELSKARLEQLKKEDEANFKLLEFRKELEIESLDLKRDRIEKEIELEEFRRDQLLENDQLLADERLLIVEESEARIAELKDEAREEEAEKVIEAAQQTADVVSDSFNAINDIAKLVGEKKLKEIDIQDKKELKKIDDLEKSKIITAAEATKQREALEEESEKKRQEIERKAFIRNKIARILQATIDTAAAVVGALKNPPGPPATIPFAVAAGALGAAQIGVIAAQQFAFGGKVKRSRVGGRSHAEGGTKYVGQDGNAFEVERGEDIFVLKRTATEAIDGLSDINQLFGGKSFRQTGTAFSQDGGVVAPVTDTLSIENQAEFANTVAEAVQGIRPVVIVDDIRDGVNDVVDVENTATK